MVDRDKVLNVLHKRFPTASLQQVAWAANAIVGLSDDWEEVAWDDPTRACPRPSPARGHCDLTDRARQDAEFRIFRKR